MICEVHFPFLLISSNPLPNYKSYQSKDNCPSFVMILGDANPSRSPIHILLVGVLVSSKTVSFFDKRLLIKA